MIDKYTQAKQVVAFDGATIKCPQGYTIAVSVDQHASSPDDVQLYVSWPFGAASAFLTVDTARDLARQLDAAADTLEAKLDAKEVTRG